MQDSYLSLKVISEIGVDLARFPTVKLLGKKFVDYDEPPSILTNFFIQKTAEIIERANSALEYYRGKPEYSGSLKRSQTVLDHLSEWGEPI